MPPVSQLPSPKTRQVDMPMQQTQTPAAKHKRFASLLRLPSSSSRRDKDKEGPPTPSRATTTAPTTPTATATATTPAHNAPTAPTAPNASGYFSTQAGASGSGSGSGTDVRSPGSKRPPASFSGHGKQLLHKRRLAAQQLSSPSSPMHALPC
ncbi:hypothetical protein G6514_002411 [Epicoccum nigrum]|nr:hypothetical protein G6514_002411 [Epicoccum nigrum]